MWEIPRTVFAYTMKNTVYDICAFICCGATRTFYISSLKIVF